MNKSLGIVILILLAIIAFLIFTAPEPIQPDYTEFEARDAQRVATIRSLQQKNENLTARITRDSVAFTKSASAQDNVSKKLRAQIAKYKANPVVIKIREETPQIDSAFQAYDSLVDSQVVEITMQGKYIQALHRDIGEMKANFEERLKLQDERFTDLQATIESQMKENRKLRRQVRVFKVLGPVALVGGFFLGN